MPLLNALPQDDILRLNLLSATGLPGLEAADAGVCLRTLDGWAAQVRAETHRLGYLFRKRPERFGGCFARFRMEVLATVLQRDLGVRYRLEANALSDDGFFKDARNLFIPGVVMGHGGTCCSQPPVYIAVGRRLGYPLRLVAAAQHLFARWDEPGGPRFNIECTAQGYVSHPDSHYLEWPKRLTPEEAERWGLMRSLTPAGEAAVFRVARGNWMLANGDPGGAATAFANAADLDPESPAHLGCFRVAARRWNDQQRLRMPHGFPPIRVRPDRQRFPKLDWEALVDLGYLTARQLLLDDAGAERRWWGPLRSDPSLRPPRVPACITADFASRPGGVDITAHDDLPAGFGKDLERGGHR